MKAANFLTSLRQKAPPARPRHGKFYLYFYSGVHNEEELRVMTGPTGWGFSLAACVLSFGGGRQIIDLISSALFLKCFWKHMTDLHIPATAHTGLIHCLLQRGMYWFINRAAYNTCSYFYFVFYARYGFCLYINKGGNSLYKEKFVIHCWQILLITWNKWAYCQHWQGLPLPTACIIALKKK